MVHINDFQKLLVRWKIFVEKYKKVFTNLCLQRFAAGLVKSYIAFLIFYSVFIIFSWLLII